MPLHRPGKGRYGKPDKQGNRLYKWQWEWSPWNQQTNSLEECKTAMDKACKLWGVPCVPVRVQHSKKDYSAYDDYDRSVRLLKCHLNIPMALHEVAHHITDVIYGTCVYDHGPSFVGVFADLLITFKIAPADAILGSLRKRKIRFSMPGQTKKAR